VLEEGELDNGLENRYLLKDNQKLRYGYTTGSCAAAAAKAAARMLLGKETVESVKLFTPAGITLHLDVSEAEKAENKVRCGVRKDAGDDPDITDGAMVYAVAERTAQPGVRIEGGIGVGRVTKPGLDQPVGEAAINRVPREMIRRAVLEEMERYGYPQDAPGEDKKRGYQGICITIEIPEGEELAKKTFNPRLGIVGGLSVLGTSGIVEPMSEGALKESIRLELRQKVLEGREYLLVSPGNYGQEYIREHLHLELEQAVKCSNYVGETIDMALELGAKGLLFVAHIGKFIKVSGGMMNTHSRWGDARMELLAAHALRAGAPLPVLREVLSCLTTEEALQKLRQAGILRETMEEMMKKISGCLKQRGYGRIKIGVLVFSSRLGELGRNEQADIWLREGDRT